LAKLQQVELHIFGTQYSCSCCHCRGPVHRHCC